MERVNDILQKISSIKIDDISGKYIFRLSFLYCIKAFLFLIILVALFFTQLYKFANQNMLQKGIWAVLLIYIIFYIYRLLKYKIVVDGKILYYEKNKIDLKKINKIQLMRTKVGGTKYDNCVALISEDKIKYVIRLNISEKYKFIALVSKISKVKVEI